MATGPDHPDGMPSLLSILDPIRDDDVQGIVENVLRKSEIHGVLDEVPSRFLRVPFESHGESRTDQIVHTKV